jgi:hypothetical protein
MESFLRVAATEGPLSTTDSARVVLAAHLHRFARALKGRTGRLLRSIVAEAQKDPATRDAFLRNYVAPRRQATRALLERGVREGEFREGLDVAGALDVLYGYFYIRLLFAHSPLDATAVDQLLDIVLKGIAA